MTRSARDPEPGAVIEAILPSLTRRSPRRLSFCDGSIIVPPWMRIDAMLLARGDAPGFGLVEPAAAQLVRIRRRAAQPFPPASPRPERSREDQRIGDGNQDAPLRCPQLPQRKRR